MGLVCPIMKYGLIYATLQATFNEKGVLYKTKNQKTNFKPVQSGLKMVILETELYKPLINSKLKNQSTVYNKV